LSRDTTNRRFRLRLIACSLGSFANSRVCISQVMRFVQQSEFTATAALAVRCKAGGIRARRTNWISVTDAALYQLSRGFESRYLYMYQPATLVISSRNISWLIQLTLYMSE
jgi:hypothetical protein